MNETIEPDEEENPLNALTDDEIRERARELHEQEWVIEIPEDAQVIRPEGEGDCARIAAWVYLGSDD